MNTLDKIYKIQEMYGDREPRNMYNKGQLVQPSDDGSRPGYANPKGNPELGTKYTGKQFKGTIRPENQKRLNKVIELITESNGSYKKNLTVKEILQKAGFKDGYQSIGTTQAIRPAIMKEMKKLLTTQQKIDNYVNNVMLSEDALVKDFKNPQQHIAKKFGVSRGTMRNWAKNSEVYKDNKNIFNGLSKELNYNKYKFVGDGVPRLMSDYSIIMQNKLPSFQMAYSADSPTKFIMDSAFRSYMQNKAAGKTPKIFFVGNPELMSPSEWKFIKGGKLYSTDPSITELEFNGKTYKNNYLNRVDAKTLYANDFGNVYKKYDDLNKYMNTFVPDPNNPKKQILLDTLLRRKAFDETGKKNFLKRRFVELDHGDLLNDPFGNNNPNNLRLLDRQTNVKAGLFKRLDKYKNNPKLLNKTLADIGYFNIDKNTDDFIKRMTKRVIPTSSKAKEIKNISAIQSKGIAKKLDVAGFKCKLADGLTCNDPRAYTQSIKENMAKVKQGDNAAVARVAKLGKAMNAFKGAARFTGWGLLAELGFAAPLATIDYAKGANKDEIISNATYGLFGKSEEEQLKEKYADYGKAQELQNTYENLLEAENLAQTGAGYRTQAINKLKAEDLNKKLLEQSKAFNTILPPSMGFKGELDYNRFYDAQLLDKQRRDDFAKEKEIRSKEIGILQPSTGLEAVQFAGGGIAGLSGGDPEGAMTKSMNPDSQGLRSLYNNVRKL